MDLPGQGQGAVAGSRGRCNKSSGSTNDGRGLSWPAEPLLAFQGVRFMEV
jgi:hypothetical protein